MVDSKYPGQAIYRFLDTNGDGTGTKNANGNYSITAEEFYFQPDGYVEIHRMIVHLADTSGMQAEEYGNLGTALSNGYAPEIQDEDGATLLDLCDGIAITANGDLGRYCYDVDVKSWGAGNEFLQARWTFTKSGAPLLIEENHRFSITLNDDFSGLLEHYFMLQGYQRT